MFSSVYIVALQTVMLNLGRKVNEVVTYNYTRATERLSNSFVHIKGYFYVDC